MADRSLTEWFNDVDRKLTHWMAGSGLILMRISIGLVYGWFGALKLFPGLSPAEPLIYASMDVLPIPTRLLIPIVGAWEVLIGLGFITGKFLRAVILLMMVQLVGAMSPLVLAPERLFTAFPYGLSLEGQYVIKDVVLASAALVIGATVRGGGLTEKPEVMAAAKAVEKNAK